MIINDDYTIIDSKILHVDERDTKRLFFLEEMFLNFINPHKEKIELCGIESPAFKAEGNLFNIGELNGILKLNLFKLGISNIMIAPMQLKKYLTGEGKGPKDLIILDIYKHWGLEIRQNDLADAYVLARISTDYFNAFTREKPLLKENKKYQLEVLNKLFESHNVKTLL